MTRPTLALDFSPTTDPFETPSWTSIVARAHKINVSIGRRNDLEPFQPGSIRVKLDNYDRLFDPLHSAGTYYPNLTPNKRIRFRCTHSAVTYEMFTGFVDGWPQNYQPPASAFCDLTATDGMKLLARSINIDPYGAVIQAEPDVFAWYRFDEAAGSVYSDSSGNGYHFAAPPAAPCADNAVDPLTSSGKNSLQLTPADPLTIPHAASFDGTEGAVEFWVRLAADAVFPYTPGDLTGLGYVQPPSLINWDQGGYPAPTYYQLSVYIDNGALFAYGNIVGSAGGMFYRAVDVNWLDGLKHHVLLYRNGDTIKILVDGAERFFELPYGGGSSNFVRAPLQINSPATAGDQWANPPVIDELVFYDAMTDPESVAVAHNEAGRRPFLGDLTGARIERILDLAGWPAGERDIDEGVSTLGAAVWDATTSALSIIDEVERSELGGFYIDHAAAGIARFRQRTARYTDPRSTTSQVALTDDQTDTSGLPYERLVASFDQSTTINKVTVKWVGGDVTATDQASIDLYGENALSMSTLLPTYEAATYFADGLLLKYGVPLPKFESVILNPAADDRLFPEVLEREIGDRITIRKQPQGVGSAIEFDCFVEGIDHNIDEGVNVWFTTYWLSRADPESYWVLNTSQLESTAVLGF